MSVYFFARVAVLALVAVLAYFYWRRRPLWRVVVPRDPADLTLWWRLDEPGDEPSEPAVRWDPSDGERLVARVRAASAAAAVARLEKLRADLLASGDWERRVYELKVAHYAKSGALALADWIARGSP